MRVLVEEAERRAAFEHGRVFGSYRDGSAIDCPYNHEEERLLRAAWLQGFSEARRSRRAA